MAKVNHQFNGDSKLLDATFRQRTDIRNALTVLQKELSRVAGCPAQLSTKIHINFSGPSPPREQVYLVTVADNDFDPATAARTTTLEEETRPALCREVFHAHFNESEVIDVQPKKRSRADVNGGEATDIQPQKRSRTNDDLTRDSTRGSMSEDATNVQRTDEVMSFLVKWHDEWKHQGGWLFDALTGADRTAVDRNHALNIKLGEVEKILGLGINSAHFATIAEIAKVLQYLPFLETCRKRGADEALAREQKWQSSRSKAHSQDRKAMKAAEKRMDEKMEAAEKRMNEELEAQRHLLVKIAHATGIEFGGLGGNSNEELNIDPLLRGESNMEGLEADGNGSATSMTTNEGMTNLDNLPGDIPGP